MKPDDILQWAWDASGAMCANLYDCHPTYWKSLDETFAFQLQCDMAHALLDAHQRGRREGMEEAAEIASPNHGAGIFNEYENGRRHAAAAIRAKAEEVDP